MGNQHGKERRNYGRKIDWENAEKPSPPGKPYLVPDIGEQSDFITIRWAPPVSDGGAPILGYVVEHRRTGSPHWLRAIPYLAVETKLTLTGLEPGWRYQFRVSAENDIGRSGPGEISEVLTVTSQRTAATAPHFNVELQDTIALENEKVEFTVHVVAIPQAKISWYKDGFEVFSSRRMKIVTENDQSTFIIHQAALEDEGEIKCAATNRAGHSVTKAILKLEAPPRIRLPRQYEDGLIFEKGEVIRLKVSTAGRPSPEVTWYHNGELLKSGGKYEIKDADRCSTLKISEASRDDRGEYVIKGANKIGEDLASFLVTVTDRPLRPGKPKVVLTPGRTVTLSWSNPEDDGGCKIGSYTVEYFRIGWNMWLKAATCRQLTTDLSELIEGSEYKFRIKAENPYGMSEPSEESDVIFVPDPKRGILTPPPKTASSQLDVWLGEAADEVKEKPNKASEKRRLLEENARKLLDTPLPVLLSQENTIDQSRKTNDSSPTRLNEHSRERTKRSFEDVGSENIPPPVPKRRHKGDKTRKTPSPMPPMETDESGEITTAEPVEGEVQYLREQDHTMFHGSSELMLVLLPDEKSKSAELSVQQRSEIEMSLIGTGIAPPISLSAPELGSGEPIEMPLMRDAVSSSELLHERAMARLYQDAMDEESQKMVKRRFSSDRKSVERRSSFREENFLERRHSFKEGILNKAAEEKSGEPEQKSFRNEGIAGDRKSMIPVPKKKSPEISEEARKERLSSVEREQLEFAKVRERIRLKNEQNLQQKTVTSPRPTGMQQGISSASSQVSSYGDDDEKMEDVGEEEEEEDYLEEEEDEEMENSESHFRSFMQSPPSLTKHYTLEVKKLAPYAEEEDITYHPTTSRIVLPKLEISLPPIIPEEKPEPKKVIAERSPEKESTPIPSKIPIKEGKKRANKLLKKLGLKKDKKVPEIVVEVESSSPESPLPKPILKNKPNKKKEKDSVKPEEAKEQYSTSYEDASDDGWSGKKKKQVRITEPSDPAEEKPVEKPVSEDEMATRVLICHYSDIVREFGQGKKPMPKQYLKTEELKAAANHLRRSPTVDSLGSDLEERGSSIDLSEVDNISIGSSTEAEVKVEVLKAVETKSPEVATVQPAKVRTFDYMTDVAMLLVACWLYLFKNELYAVPVLCLMVYRQLNDAVVEKYRRAKESFAKKFARRKPEGNG